jgi:hypothetical protein
MFFREPLFGRLRIADGILLITVMIVLAACGGSDTNVETVQEATLNPGDAVPAPTGEVVLTITGDIANTNVGDALVFDMETLESLGLIRYGLPGTANTTGPVSACWSTRKTTAS